jgi:hypothetical protein
MAMWKIVLPVVASTGIVAASVLALRGGDGEGGVAREAVSDAAGVTCRIEATRDELPGAARETSGLARGIAHAGMFWTHNDAGGEPVLFGFDDSGALRAQVRVEGAPFTDWEDIEGARCGSGSCLFIADTGDNEGERDEVVIYEVPEPSPDQTSASAKAYRARYPDGQHDSEALFAHGGDLFLVTKGRRGPIGLYRFPGPRTPGSTATLEHVARLGPEPKGDGDRVTAATASPDGRWIVVATYRWLNFYPAAELLRGQPGEPRRFDLRPLRQDQIEAVAMGDDGRVWVTSEAANKNSPPTWSRLACTLP